MDVKTPDRSLSSSSRLRTGFLLSISSLMAICAKHASRVSRKLRAKALEPSKNSGDESTWNEGFSPCRSPAFASRSPWTAKSPLRARPKQLFTNISNKAMSLVSRNKKSGADSDSASEEFGDGGVWQKAILMGDKCQPLDFSGVIYYDSRGKQLEELPFRSPRASPMRGYVARAN
ncbi:uncharacterized protein LOC110820343 [Carica papaya]|uniref:uncharacterized protein LOC110820343 n=1 Tax=Carica papaya TaxID=3649 RepID=UPI000B8D19FC|nr:uncharacterized protein LOC110820343 [Carica papaya]